MPIQIGHKAPSFPVQSTAGDISLDLAKGRNLVVFFYPKDNTPGCTIEAQQYAELYEAFKTTNTEVVGVSRDSLKSHESFREKLDLVFHLIADTNEQFCTVFDVMRNKMMYGKQVRGLERSTFVFDKMNELVREWRGVKVDGHAAEVLNFCKTLN